MGKMSMLLVEGRFDRRHDRAVVRSSMMTGSFARRFAFAVTLLIGLAGCNRQTPTAVKPLIAIATPSTIDARQVVQFLSSDALQGRAPGTAGLDRAGDYLSARFTELKLQPLPGQSNFFEPFSMPLPATLEPPTQLNLGEHPLVIDADYAPLFSTGEGRFNASVIFAGYGITRPGYDDYAGHRRKRATRSCW